MIRPTQDWLCLKRLEYKHKKLYVYGQVTHRGICIAAGPGYYEKAWKEVEDPFNGKKFRARVGPETNRFIPTTVKPGETVEYSNAGWEEREIQGEKYIFVRERSVICYADLKDTEGFQEHESPDLDA